MSGRPKYSSLEMLCQNNKDEDTIPNNKLTTLLYIRDSDCTRESQIGHHKVEDIRPNFFKN